MSEELKLSKNRIVEDWLNAFPELTKVAQNKFYKIIGAIVTGIELIKLPSSEEYRPHFVVYPLWGKDIKECLSAPLILMEFKNRKGLQLTIPYLKHNAYFEEAKTNIRKQLLFPLEGDVQLKSLFSAIDIYSKEPPLGASPNSYLQAKLLGFKYRCALYVNNDEAAQKVLTQIDNKNWDLQHFALWNVDFSKWFHSIKEIDKSLFIATIENNKSEKKLSKLFYSKLM